MINLLIIALIDNRVISRVNELATTIYWPATSNSSHESQEQFRPLTSVTRGHHIFMAALYIEFYLKFLAFGPIFDPYRVNKEFEI